MKMKYSAPKHVKDKWDWSKQDKIEAELRESSKKHFNYLSPKNIMDKESLKSSLPKINNKEFAKPVVLDKDYLSVFKSNNKLKVKKFSDSPKADRGMFK